MRLQVRQLPLACSITCVINNNLHLIEAMQLPTL